MKANKPISVKLMESRMDRLAQTVSRCKGMKKINGVWASQCVTCGKWGPCFGAGAHQGGHFIPRGCRITRWEPMNIWPQCIACNNYRDGAYIEYSHWMMKNHPEVYDGVIALYDQHKRGAAPKLSVIEKRALYNSWLKKGRGLEKKIGRTIFPKSWDYVKM